MIGVVVRLIERDGSDWRCRRLMKVRLSRKSCDVGCRGRVAMVRLGSKAMLVGRLQRAAMVGGFEGDDGEMGI